MDAIELRKRYAEGQRDFTGVNLRGIDLRGVDLRDQVSFGDADLTGANLSGAYLPGSFFSGARLHNTDLTQAYLSDSNFSAAHLTGANLSRAQLVRSDLHDVDLTGAILSGANLAVTNLLGAILRDADLTGINLQVANLTDADITGAKCNNAKLDYTLLINLDIAPFAMAEGVRHGGPSTVDHRTIARSLQSGEGLLQFLVATGMPTIYATYAFDCIKSLDPEMLFSLMQNTFISYGRPDESFAKKLNQILLQNGVQTYLYIRDAEWGAQHHRHLRAKINEHDRVLLICSQSSLTRKGVIDEIRKTLARETREGCDELLLPVTIDDFIFEGWEPEDSQLKQAVLDRVVGNFRGADGDDSVLAAQLPRLLKALQKVP